MTLSEQKELEKESCAVSLSDMEIFVFPDIMYSLVLANIMSPVIWKWLEDPWFDKIDEMKPYRKVLRLRQYIMDHYSFNLDLDTWGLTDKKTELNRFNDFIDPEILKNSNALFGYEGDKYYFDIDIRRHFGLDKYNSDIIPYWKTETVEAMDAFQYMAGYDTGAGECVSLAALWASALFIICKIPLEDIFMMATPLHSQNFVFMKEGIITNNRRIVTKNMWVNGTELSAKARRALENEQVTLVSHISGYIHVMYGEATIDGEAYDKFAKKLTTFLRFNPTAELLNNFLRWKSEWMKCFQLKRVNNGLETYIELERVFAYEHNSNYSISGSTRKKLLEEIDGEEFYCSPLRNRLVLNDIEEFIRKNHIKADKIEKLNEMKSMIDCPLFAKEEFVKQFIDFCKTIPRLPEFDRKEVSAYQRPIEIKTEMSREEIISYLKDLQDGNPMAKYAFHAYRDLKTVDAAPFLRAAIHRNPVCLEALKDKAPEEIVEILGQLDNISIYQGKNRLAQPDEVWNSTRGDGLEKALLLAIVLIHRNPEMSVVIRIEPSECHINFENTKYSFKTEKEVRDNQWELKLSNGI